MAAAGLLVQQQAQDLMARLRTMLNTDLKEMCRQEKLPVSGVKAALQNRLNDHITYCVRNGDAASVRRMQALAYGGSVNAPSMVNTGSGHPASSSSPPQAGAYFANSYGQTPVAPPARTTSVRAPSAATPRVPTYHPRTLFKESPFYKYEETIMPTMEISASPNLRSHVRESLALSPQVCERLKADPSLRIFLFSAAEPSMPYVRSEIAFPHHMEVRVNGDEIKSNFKGLKNKPGTTRPADLTDFVRKLGNYQNPIVVTYAQTQKKFFFIVNLIKRHSVEDLTEQIKNGRIITKDTVIKEMRKKADDPDIIATSTVLSLKDPVSTLRIDVPCRSTICSHNQCFDAASFLQLQEQAPTWVCPICNRTVAFEGLVVDQYVQDILKATPSSVDQVIIEPDGQWRRNSDSDGSSSRKEDSRYGASNGNDDYGDDDDDLIDITDHRVSAIKTEATSSSFLARTPPLSSREASAGAPKSGNKRKAEVIDLTLSDDDEVPPASKRLNYNTPNSISNASRNGNKPPPMASTAHTRPLAGTRPPLRIPSSHVHNSAMNHSMGMLPHRLFGSENPFGFDHGGPS